MLFLICWRTSFTNSFIRMGVRAHMAVVIRTRHSRVLQRYRNNDGWGGREQRLKMSVLTSASWSTHVFSTAPGILPGPVASFIFSFSHIHCAYLLIYLLVFWRQHEHHSWVFVEDIRVSINCVQLLWQRGLTLATAFVACDILNHLS